MKFFINPGHSLHGMPDAGACNDALRLRESDIAAEIGSSVEYYLKKAGCQTKLLQSHNLVGEAVDYPSVTKVANGWGADAFVSIHCNSVANPWVRGIETLCFDRHTNGGKLAQCIQSELVTAVRKINLNYEAGHDRGVKERPGLAVLWATSMPAALVEIGFISSEEDCVIMTRHKDEIARAIARGCTDYWQYIVHHA